MGAITIERLSITNFKGIKSLDVKFSGTNTISGDNGVGKTSISDAMHWCIFGKNSQGETDFSIKSTTDLSLNRCDHVVVAYLRNDGTPMILKRLYREKWVKKRGSEESERTGHETLYFWDDVPVSAGEYSIKVSEQIPEQRFRMLTNPYFIANLKWQERRTILEPMSGITDEKVINGTPEFRELFANLGKITLEDQLKKIAASKTIIKKQLPQFGPRIDEVNRSNPKVESWNEIEKEIISKEGVIITINNGMEGKLSSHDKVTDGIKAKQAEAIAASRKMGDIENELTKKAYAEASEANKSLNEAKYNLGVVREELRTKLMMLRGAEIKHKQLESELVILRKKYEVENAKPFTLDPNSCTCYACLRPFDPAEVEAKRIDQGNKYRVSQDQVLDAINAEGIPKKAEQTECANRIAVYLQEIELLKIKENSLVWSVDAVKAEPKPINLTANSQYQALKLVSEQVIEVKTIDFTEQKEIKAQIQEGIDELKKILQGRDVLEKNAIRIEELKAEERQLSKELADLEKQEFVIESFQKAKANMVESSINKQLGSGVTVKMYEDQINGGQTPCCEILIDGVPFSDANHAGQVKAGMTLIGAVSGYYKDYAPLFIDNSEAVNDIPPTLSQLIKLRVTTSKKLEFTNN